MLMIGVLAKYRSDEGAENFAGWSSGASDLAAGFEDLPDHRGALVVGAEPRAARIRERPRRPDPPAQVRATGRGVVVGGVIKGLERHANRVLLGEPAAPQLLQRTAREEGPGADRVEVVLLVAAAGDVVGEDPAGLPVEVETGEERHHGQTLHRHAEVAADHRREPVGLADQRKSGALDLLVVLQLDLEE